MSLAISGKSVILGMVKAPKLEDYIGNDRSKGVSNYIVNPKSEINEYIYTTELHQNIDVFPSETFS